MPPTSVKGPPPDASVILLEGRVSTVAPGANDRPPPGLRSVRGWFLGAAAVTAFASLLYVGYVIQPADDMTRPVAIIIAVPVVVLAIIFPGLALLIPHRRPWVRHAVLASMLMVLVSGALMVLAMFLAMFTARFFFVDPNPVVGGILIASAGVALTWIRRPDVRAWYGQ